MVWFFLFFFLYIWDLVYGTFVKFDSKEVMTWFFYKFHNNIMRRIEYLIKKLFIHHIKLSDNFEFFF